MRRFLDTLYRASGAVAAAFICAICVVVVLQVGANIVDAAAGWLLGAPFGLLLPSYAEFTGFFLVAATFFALAHALRAGSHIRVTLLIRSLSGRARRVVELWCVGVAAVLSGYFTFYAFRLVRDSARFGDLAVGMVPLPLWIPQSAIALGLVVLTIALVDEFVCLVRGAPPSYDHTTRADGAPLPGDPGAGPAA